MGLAGDCELLVRVVDLRGVTIDAEAVAESVLTRLGADGSLAVVETGASREVAVFSLARSVVASSGLSAWVSLAVATAVLEEADVCIGSTPTTGASASVGADVGGTVGVCASWTAFPSETSTTSATGYKGNQSHQSC